MNGRPSSSDTSVRKDLSAIGDAHARLYAAQHAVVAEFETIAPDYPFFLTTP
jgi:hypothetical protein